MPSSESYVATLAISVDISRQQENSTLVTELLHILLRHHVTALWSFEFLGPASLGVERVRSFGSGHEFGLLANRSWLSRATTRNAFRRELSSRLDRARQQGTEPLSLTMSDSDPPEYLDVLARSRLLLLRTRTDVTQRGGPSVPRWGRMGIWQWGPSIVLPVASRWPLAWRTHQSFRRAIEQQTCVHIAIDSERLAQHQARGFTTLEYILQHAAQRREDGQVRIVQPSHVVDSIAPRRTQFISRSILRAA